MDGVGTQMPTAGLTSDVIRLLVVVKAYLPPLPEHPPLSARLPPLVRAPHMRLRQGCLTRTNAVVRTTVDFHVLDLSTVAAAHNMAGSSQTTPRLSSLSSTIHSASSSSIRSSSSSILSSSRSSTSSIEPSNVAASSSTRLSSVGSSSVVTLSSSLPVSISSSVLASSSSLAVTSSSISTVASSSSSVIVVSSIVQSASSVSAVVAASSTVSLVSPSAISNSVVATPSASEVARVWVPSRNPTVDRTRTDRLVPANVLSLYYVEQSPGTLSKIDTVTLASGAKGILLEDISTVDSVTCSGSTISITFTDSVSAATARSWAAGTLLFTLADGCNTASERGVYLVNNPITSRSLQGRQSLSTLLQFAVSQKSLLEIIASLIELIQQLLATPTPTPSVSTPTPSADPSDSQCVWTPAPAGSTCFTLTGHGASHIEGKVLGMKEGNANPTLGWDEYTPSIFYLDATGTVGVATSTRNGVIMANAPETTDTPWMLFVDPSAAQAAGYTTAVCSLNAGNSLTCSLYNGLYTFWTTYYQLLATDSRSVTPMWGQATGLYVPLTLSYTQVTCPALCPGTKPTPTPTPVEPTPTPTPTPSGPPWCGGYTGGGAVVVNGHTWDIYCGIQVAEPLQQISYTYAKDFSVCMDYCTAAPGCIAVDFRETGKYGGRYRCRWYSQVGLPEDGTAGSYLFDAAYLVGGPVIPAAAESSTLSSIETPVPTPTTPSFSLAESQSSIPELSSTLVTMISQSTSTVLPTTQDSTSLMPVATSESDSPTPVATPSPSPTGNAPCFGLTNGRMTSAAGDIWDIHCGVQGTEPVTRIDFQYVPTWELCFAYCRERDDCVAVQWREIMNVGPSRQCSRYSALGLPDESSPDMTGSYDVAYLISTIVTQSSIASTSPLPSVMATSTI
ncbi:Nn.00g028080.m01.CDS01 [Neocucurbitaria sp. VM-36]